MYKGKGFKIYFQLVFSTHLMKILKLVVSKYSITSDVENEIGTSLKILS